MESLLVWLGWDVIMLLSSNLLRSIMRNEIGHIHGVYGERGELEKKQMTFSSRIEGIPIVSGQKLLR